MSAKIKVVRLLTGTLLVVAIVVATFAMLPRWTPTWGATDAEVARALPGDDLIARAPGDTTHGVTIDAPPEEVWPWIAQMGDVRGGFYSYTFIENLLQKTAAGGEAVYHNASRVLPHFQNPQPGDGLVLDSLRVHAVEPGEWLLAAQKSEEGDFNWVWLWHLEPVGASQARLLVRMAIRLPGVGDNPVVSKVTDLGAFVMGRRMVHGLRLRAEGGTEPAGIEAIEILLWVAALAVGIGAAALFVTHRAWLAPLLLGLAALLTLIWFTAGQPSVWLRILLDIALLALLGWVARRAPKAAGMTSQGVPSAAS
ncbi:MAG TPA: hypothetical protein PKO09_13230 [Anaerolineae bacterium]|nr:hypothetical protein [Anaerolineae bacterium]